MNRIEALLAARALLENVTPLKGDCGRICGGACCEPDEDGQGGMLLFPGEEGLYDPLPEGFTVTPAPEMPGALLITCSGRCQRKDRPLSCRLFPLLPKEKDGAVRAVRDRHFNKLAILAHAKELPGKPVDVIFKYGKYANWNGYTMNY